MVLTEREKEVLDVLVEMHTVKTAATKLHLSPSTLYNMLYRLREKQTKARKLINTLLGYRRKSSLIDKVLSRKIRIEEEELSERG